MILNKSDVKLGRKKDVIHYVPIEDTIRNLVEDSSFIQMSAMCSMRRRNPSKIYDVKDGLYYKENKFFQENPDSYGIILYSDAVEIKNPLGAARGCYKLVQVFFTLCEVEKAQRSKIDRLSLCMVFREKLLKKYTLERIFRRLVEDLMKIEGGMVIGLPVVKTIKCGVACYSADNLEAHIMGGFRACFSSGEVCRVCHINYCDLDDNIHDLCEGGNIEKWTVSEYDQIVNTFKETDHSSDDEVDDDLNLDLSSDDSDLATEKATDGDYLNSRGLKSMCPLNVLSSFHCINGFPPDVLHDVMEGVIPEDLLAIIRILSKKGWFSIAEYNVAMENLGFLGYERNDRPYPVPTASNVKKLKGKALS